MQASLFENDRFLVDQLLRPMVNLYTVSTLGPDGKSAGKTVAFARQKRMALKEDLRFFADDSETEEVFRLKARRVVEIGGRYEVTQPSGERIGILEKRFKQSLIRSTWSILDASEDQIAWARERNAYIAIIRRIKDLVPYGETIPIPYHFTFLRGEREIGEVTRVLGLRDKYILDLSPDAERTLDRRLAIALAVGLDAFQAR
ncbi:MAG TPA: hypothetical protein VK285_08185 [Gaiellaceae bacterium]|nr:hypothetical protein [Gaiellaceae bacterium]